MSDLVATAAQDATYHAIEEAQIIRISVEDQRMFAEAIINPPAPNDALRRAARFYLKLIADAR